jgi:hypothetical protein
MRPHRWRCQIQHGGRARSKAMSTPVQIYIQNYFHSENRKSDANIGIVFARLAHVVAHEAGGLSHVALETTTKSCQILK